MKIGIITFWQSRNNYGQVLQLFAMQQVLKKLGHEPFLIKYHRVAGNQKNSLLDKLSVKNMIRWFYNRFRKTKPSYDDLRKFDEFKKDNIIFGDINYYSFGDLKETPPVAEAYIVGSDQVWNNSFFVSAEAFLLGFGPTEIARIAYAASFGQRSLDLETQTMFRKYLPNFKSIGVREESGVDICKKLNHPQAEWVLDPTLLFNELEWAKLLILPTKQKIDQIFIYTLGNSEIVDKKRYVEYAKSIDNYKVKHATANDDPTGSYWPTIPGWVDNIRCSKLVITTSFHGVVFCIINNTNFIILPNTGQAEGMNERVESLLGMLGLEEHLMREFSEDKFNHIFKKEIDWKKINGLIEDKRRGSLQFLVNSLS